MYIQEDSRKNPNFTEVKRTLPLTSMRLGFHTPVLEGLSPFVLLAFWPQKASIQLWPPVIWFSCAAAAQRPCASHFPDFIITHLH